MESILKCIKNIDKDMVVAAKKRLDSLSKPLGSLGRLEDMVMQICGITRQLMPSIDKKAIVVMCSDNGVVEEGVTQVGKEVTAAVVMNFTRGITGINVLAKHCGADVVIVDIGVDADVSHPHIFNRKIRNGTWNISKGPAMTRQEAEKAIVSGVELVGELKKQGYGIIGTGEMGIGNTTTSSAVACAITGFCVDCMVGRGAGLSDEGLKRKRDVVRKALEINKPDRTDGIDVVSKVGGFDIAGLAGCFIGGAVHKMPIVIDGFISMAAALVAATIEPKTKQYMIPSHFSAEPGTMKLFEYLQLKPYLHLDMRLGEGTGCALAFHIIDAAFAAYKYMGTFSDANIRQYEPQR